MNVEHYILCLDTDQYAGNFERETTAYATGIIGDCGVGKEESDSFHTSEVPKTVVDELERKVTQISDDNGCVRPCQIQESPEWVTDGMGTSYRQCRGIPPTPEQIEKYRESWRRYHGKTLETAKGYWKWPPESIARLEDEIAEIEMKVPVWFHASNTVGIYLSEPLSEATLQVVLCRAKQFLTSKGTVLEQVRLVTVYADTKSEVINWKESQ